MVSVSISEQVGRGHVSGNLYRYATGFFYGYEMGNVDTQLVGIEHACRDMQRSSDFTITQPLSLLLYGPREGSILHVLTLPKIYRR
jgi:hypothetical protein